MLFLEVKALLKKELLLEWRHKFALYGLALYVGSTIYVCYLSFNTTVLQPITWNALFWIIMLFTAINAIAKGFMQEREGRYLYYYTIASPQAVIVAKIIYNAGFMLLLTLLGFSIYSFVLGSPVQTLWLFALNMVLAALGFSSTLTLVSGIAAKAGNNPALMAILSFPVMLPILLMVIKVAKNAVDGLAWSASQQEVITLLALNVLLGAVAYLLFPYLWRS